MSSANLQMSAEKVSTSLYDRAEKAARMIRTRVHDEPSVAIVLGSGLGAFANDLAQATAIPYNEIPGFARATVEGHAGRLVIGKVGDSIIAAQQGRFHFYGGYSLQDVTFPIAVLKLVGDHTLLLTNASGGLNTAFAPGLLIISTDRTDLIGLH